MIDNLKLVENLYPLFELIKKEGLLDPEDCPSNFTPFNLSFCMKEDKDGDFGIVDLCLTYGVRGF